MKAVASLLLGPQKLLADYVRVPFIDLALSMLSTL